MRQWLSSRPKLTAYLLALPLAVAVAMTQPIWNRDDEVTHYDLIAQYASGNYPMVNAPLRPETLSLMQIYGHQTYDTFDVLLPKQTFANPPAGMNVLLPPTNANAATQPVWIERHYWQYSAEAEQSPLLYVAAVPVWDLGKLIDGPLGALYAVRLLNAVLLALLAPLAWLLIRMLAPEAKMAQWFVVVVVSLSPGVVMTGTHITNDTLSMVLSGAALVLAIDRWRRGWSWRSAILIGMLLGLGLLTKLTVLGLALPVALAIVWPAVKTPWLERVKQFILTGGVATACLTPWLVINKLFLGTFIQNNSSIYLHLAPSLSDTPSLLGKVDLGVQEINNTFWQFWAGDPPIRTFSISDGLVKWMIVLIILAIIGLWLFWREASRERRGMLWLCVVAVFSSVALTFALPTITHSEFRPPGRYIYPALLAVVALLAVGLWRIPLSAINRRLVLWAYILLAVLTLSGNVFLGQPLLRPGEATPPMDAVAYDTSGACQTASGLSISVDQARLDRRTLVVVPYSNLWLHIVAVNRSPETIEWTANPSLSLDGRTKYAWGDPYLNSGFPIALEAGQSTEGWVEIQLGFLANAKPLESPTLTATFPNVANIEYRQIENCVASLSLRSSAP